MTAPEARTGGLDGNARGLVVLVVALAVGFLLLLNAGGGGGTTTAASDDTVEGPTTTAPLTGDVTDETTTTTTEVTSSRSPSEVKVLVLNGSGPTGAAAATTETIAASGYEMGDPVNGPAIDATTIYYVEDFEAEATSVALLLGKSPDAVTPIAEGSLGGAEGDADVVVLLGADTPPVSETTTTTTAN